ncbi:MAG: biopolymer transporter ExbD [Chthoniobacteraceae bacterium]
MRIRNDHEENFELPLVPMIDMMFVLLIFFMVATTLKITQPELPVNLPESAAALDVKVDPGVLVIGIDRNGQKYLDGNPATTDDLHRRLQQAAAKGPDQPVRLDIDKDTRYEQIIEVLELCQFEGLKNVGFHTRKAPKNG